VGGGGGGGGECILWLSFARQKHFYILLKRASLGRTLPAQFRIRNCRIRIFELENFSTMVGLKSGMSSGFTKSMLDLSSTFAPFSSRFSATWGQCYEFKSIFAEKIGDFDSNSSCMLRQKT
jgi:hypothetical protein